MRSYFKWHSINVSEQKESPQTLSKDKPKLDLEEPRSQSKLYLSNIKLEESLCCIESSQLVINKVKVLELTISPALTMLFLGISIKLPKSEIMPIHQFLKYIRW